jgi:hypothetical protein
VRERERERSVERERERSVERERERERATKAHAQSKPEGNKTTRLQE